MPIYNPHLGLDPFELLGTSSDSELASLGEALGGGSPAWADTPANLAGVILWHPWRVPCRGLDDPQADAWLEYRQALATHRTLWEREDSDEPAHHDQWVEVLDRLLGVVASEEMRAAMRAFLSAAGFDPLDEVGFFEVIGSYMVDHLLAPVDELVKDRPGRFQVQAAHLIVVKALGELGTAPDAHRTYLERVLRAGGILWLEVGRPDRAMELLDELRALVPDDAGVAHYAVRARLLRLVADLGGRKGLPPARTLKSVLGDVEALAFEHPLHWEVRTQLAELFVRYAREAIEQRRASDAAESVVKAMVADVGWPACAAMAGDVEGSMHEAKLVGGLGQGAAPGFKEAAASEQLRSAIRAGFSRGEMYLAREQPWRLFNAWPGAEAARLWHDLHLPMDGGTFPEGCAAWLDVVVDALEEGVDDPMAVLRVRAKEVMPEVGPEALDGPVARWVDWARQTRESLHARVTVKDLLFLHRIRGRAKVAPPVGEPPFYRPVLGFGLEEGDQGLVVKGLKPGGAAAQAGLQDGDLLLELRGYPCPTTQRIIFALLGWRPGEAMSVKVRRGREVLDLELSPREHRDMERLPRKEMARRFEKLFALRVERDMRVKAAPRVGLLCQVTEGDVILRVDGMPVRTPEQLEEVTRTLEMGQFTIFTVRRGDEHKLAKVVTLSFPE